MTDEPALHTWTFAPDLTIELLDDRVSNGGRIRLRVTKAPDRQGRLAVNLFEIKPTVSMFALGTSFDLVDGQREVLGEIHVTDRQQGPHAVFVGVTMGNSQPIPAVMPSGPFASIWIADDANWPSDIEQSTRDMLAKQTEYRSHAYRLKDYGGTESFEVNVLLDGCLLDYPQPIIGGMLSPLSTRLGPESHMAAINAAFQATFILDENAQARFSSSHPLSNVTFWNVQAPDPDGAVAAISAPLTLLRNTIAMSRGAFPSGMACVLRRASDGAVFFSLSSPLYRGNLLSGFFAGEVTERFDLYKRAAETDPWIELIAGMYGEALAETNVLFQVVKLWAVLEACASRRHTPGSKLVMVTTYTMDIMGLRAFRYNQKTDNDTIMRHFYKVRNIGAHEGVIHEQSLTQADRESVEFVFGPTHLGILKDIVCACLDAEASKAAGRTHSP